MPPGTLAPPNAVALVTVPENENVAASEGVGTDAKQPRARMAV
jgi:hypothetical protein